MHVVQLISEDIMARKDNTLHEKRHPIFYRTMLHPHTTMATTAVTYPSVI